MTTISSKINPKEYAVISHYANCCGETISNLIRKVLIKEATFSGGFGGSGEYNCDVIVPDGCSSEEDSKITKDAYNYSRRVLGFEEIDEI